MTAVKRVTPVLLGNLLLTGTASAIVIPAGLISGGTTGIGLCMQAYFHIPVWLTWAVVNSVLFLVGLVLLGRHFALTTLLSTVTGPVFLRAFEALPALPGVTRHLPLWAVLAGLLCGLGIGMVIRAGASTGGMDVPPIIANKWIGCSIGAAMLLQDGVILLAQLPFSGRGQIFCGGIYVLLLSLTIDLVVGAGGKEK